MQCFEQSQGLGDGRSFANETSPGMSPHSISPVMGDIVSSSTTSSQTRTVETVTVSKCRCAKRLKTDASVLSTKWKRTVS